MDNKQKFTDHIGDLQKETKKRFSGKKDITSGMIKVILICWLVPFLALSIVLFYFSEKSTSKQINSTIETSIDNVSNIMFLNLKEASTQANQFSFEKTLKIFFEGRSKEVKGKKLSEEEEKVKNYYVKDQQFLKTSFESDITKELEEQYKFNEWIPFATIEFAESQFNKSGGMYATSSNRAGGSMYKSTNAYKNSGMREIALDYMKKGSTYSAIFVTHVNNEHHMYLVRNLCRDDYVPYAVFVTEISIKNVFSCLENTVWLQDMKLYLNNEIIFSDCSSEKISNELSKRASNVIWSDNNTDVMRVDSLSYDTSNGIVELKLKAGLNVAMLAEIQLDKVGIMNENSTVVYFYILIILLMIPLLAATVMYFYKNVSQPINSLVMASEKIEKGEYGVKIEPYKKNEEFGKLVDTFNNMSVSLKESFDKIIVEEIAARDANMHALQAQINPHFLNNTLEIINWKARMSGNDDVSGMIESLGIMMEATMNRRNESFITIKEEMTYVDAYLYIIYQRFGNKFIFEKQVDENLYNIKIPRLIIQPLVENAVDHGGDSTGKRIGKLTISGDSDNLYIIVENNGTISDQERKKIDELLASSEYNDAKHKNIGIRNVNIRLKILYGENSGLTIESSSEGKVVSKVIIEKKYLT